MELYRIAQTEEGLSGEEIRACLLRVLADKSPKKALILPPDYTRFHSGAGAITNYLYHVLTGRCAAVDILPALGTHAPLSRPSGRPCSGISRRSASSCTTGGGTW